MAVSPVSNLPEELLLYIFEQHDSPAPSELKDRQEPSLQLTSNCISHCYKDLSLVSQRWRRIVLPLLFKYSRLRLDLKPREEWAVRSVGTTGTQSGDGDPDHLRLRTRTPEDESEGSNADAVIPSQDSNYPGAARFYHCLKDYLAFVHANHLSTSVHSFVVMTESILQGNQGRFPHQSAEKRAYYEASASFWKLLYAAVTPTRVVIVAPPADLACLTNCAIDLFSDWAFTDMDFHILELRLDSPDSIVAARLTTSQEVIPQQYPGVADSSVLRLQPWSQLSLNEGSFIRAYGTYEYFERGPPSLIASIKDCIASNRGGFRNQQTGMDLTALRSFTYTAIFPFAHHLDFRGLLHHIAELDCKLAPDPDFPLTDKDRVGKAELEDCWQEFFSAYRLIVRPFRTFDIRPDGSPKLEKFTCKDVQISALRAELDDEFICLCMPVWVEFEPGVFTRQQQLPPTYQHEAE